MDIIAVSATDIGDHGASEPFIGEVDIALHRQFDIARQTFREADVMARPFGDRRVIGEGKVTGRRSLLMSIEDGRIIKGLRRLCCVEAGTIDGCDDASVFGTLQRIRNGKRGKGGLGAAVENGSDSIHERCRHEGANRIMNEGKAGCSGDERLEPIEHGMLAGRPP